MEDGTGGRRARGREEARNTGVSGPRAPGPGPKSRNAAGFAALNVRKAETEDAEAVSRVRREAMRAKASGSYTPEQIEAWIGGRGSQDWLYAMTDGGETLFVAEVSGRIVGFASLKDDEVMAVYAAPDAPPGAGSALLAAVEAEARARGIDRLQLMSTLNAVGFYEKQGYRRIGEAEFPMAGGVRIRMVEMDKELRQSG